MYEGHHAVPHNGGEAGGVTQRALRFPSAEKAAQPVPVEVDHHHPAPSDALGGARRHHAREQGAHPGGAPQQVAVCGRTARSVGDAWVCEGSQENKDRSGVSSFAGQEVQVR